MEQHAGHAVVAGIGVWEPNCRAGALGRRRASAGEGRRPAGNRTSGAFALFWRTSVHGVHPVVPESGPGCLIVCQTG